VFERFTDRARRVIVLAQEEARTLNHNYIGVEHLLLGLVHEGEGIAAQALTALGVTTEGVREHIEEGERAPTGHIPFTPRAKKVMELALREALQLGHNYIGTEHLLLGLIRDDGATTKRLIGEHDLNQVRIKVLQILQNNLDARVKIVEKSVAKRPADEQLALQLEQIARQVRTYSATGASIKRSLEPGSGVLTYKLKFCIEGWKGDE
jgi:ATP-dependent Clp protease ATP-binding subunit ClpC